MKCPLLAITDVRVGREGFPPNAECIGEECAWWDRVTARCHLVTLSIDIDRCALRLANIADRLPPKKEF